MVLTGASSLEQLKENIGDFENFKPLNEEEYRIIDEVVEILNSNIAIDCTKCKYCLEACPESINIPKLFDLYNSEKMLGAEGWSAFGNAYLNYSKHPGSGIASDCNYCESCVEDCPQHIDIPDMMEK